MAEHSSWCRCDPCLAAGVKRAVDAWYRDEASWAYLRAGQAALTEYGLRAKTAGGGFR